MRQVTWIAVLFAMGCVTHKLPQGDDGDPQGDPGNGKPDPVLVDDAPGTCGQSLTLVVTGQERATIGPVTLGNANLCLHLDATQALHPYFATTTSNESGSQSSFDLALSDSTGTAIIAGWDVVFGQTNPTAFQNLEWSFDGNSSHDVVLNAHARSADATTTLQIWLQEELED